MLLRNLGRQQSSSGPPDDPAEALQLGTSTRILGLSHCAFIEQTASRRTGAVPRISTEGHAGHAQGRARFCSHQWGHSSRHPKSPGERRHGRQAHVPTPTTVRGCSPLKPICTFHPSSLGHCRASGCPTPRTAFCSTAASSSALSPAPTYIHLSSTTGKEPDARPWGQGSQPRPMSREITLCNVLPPPPVSFHLVSPTPCHAF